MLDSKGELFGMSLNGIFGIYLELTSILCHISLPFNFFRQLYNIMITYSDIANRNAILILHLVLHLFLIFSSFPQRLQIMNPDE